MTDFYSGTGYGRRAQVVHPRLRTLGKVVQINPTEYPRIALTTDKTEPSTLLGGIRHHPVATLGLICLGLFAIAGYQRNAEYQHRVEQIRDNPAPASSAPHLFQTEPASPEARLSYSFLSPTGNVDDFCEQIQGETRFTFDCAKRQEFRLLYPITVFVAGWKDGKMFWSHKMRTLKAGELMFTDGENTYLAKCGNKVSFVPAGPNLADVPDDMLEVPAVQAIEPPVTLAPSVKSSESTTDKKKAGFMWAVDTGIVAAGVGGAVWRNHSPEPPPQTCTDAIEMLKTCN